MQKNSGFFEFVVFFGGQRLANVLRQGFDVSSDEVKQLGLERLDVVVHRAQVAFLLVFVGKAGLPQVTVDCSVEKQFSRGLLNRKITSLENTLDIFYLSIP